MVATYKTFAPGARQAAKAYAAHLMEKTLPAERMAQAIYYTQGDPAPDQAVVDAGSIPTVSQDLHPALSDALGIAPGAVLTAEQLAHILAGKRADGDDLPLNSNQHTKVRDYDVAEGETPRSRVAGIDITLNAPKSLSVAWAAAETEAERWSLYQAHKDAVRDAFKYAEQEVFRARIGDGGKGGSEQAHAAIISVDHFTARPTVEIERPDPETGVMGTEIYTVQRGDKLAGDMHLHTHGLWVNLMATDSGRLTAMNRDQLDGRVHEIGAVYHMMLAKYLRDIGVEVERDADTHTVSLKAIPRPISEAFSHRTNNGSEAAKELAAEAGMDWKTMPADMKVALLKGGVQKHKLPHSFQLTAEERKTYEAQARKDDLANFPAWQAAFKRLGWSHKTVIAQAQPGEAPAPPTDAERHRAGWKAALPLLESELNKLAVITGVHARIAAARGMIESGAQSIDDVRAVVGAMARDGVQQQGRMTKLLAPRGMTPRAKITTALHRDQELEVIALAKAEAGHDRFKIGDKLLREVTAKYRFPASTERQATLASEQQRAIKEAARGAGFNVFIGVAGVGKTKAVLPPLVAAAHAQGREVWGTALSWKQSNELAEAGIEGMKTRALQPFLEGMREGSMVPKPGALVVVDEFSQIGTRQLLELLRAQRQHKFQIVLTGDELQCQSIESGAIIDLLREAVGKERIPEILTSIRQESEREQIIAGLFRGTRDATEKERISEVAQALRMKREDGTVELVAGGRQEVIDRAAEAFMAAVMRNHNNPAYKVTVSAPSNLDALDISTAIRGLRKAAGQIGEDLAVVPAMDGAGNRFDMALAKGDRIRLFSRTWGLFTDAQGRQRNSHIGNNGTVLRIRDVVDEGQGKQRREGLIVETPNGKVGFIPWAKLRQEGTDRVKLAYGDCLTIDSSQGITSDEHINAMPNGSGPVQGFKSYVANSRHRIRSLLLTSQGAELAQVDQRRPEGQQVPERWRDREAEIWNNLARNLAQQSVKETAFAMLKAAAQGTRQAARGLQRNLRQAEAQEAAGQGSGFRERAEEAQAVRQLTLALKRVADEVGSLHAVVTASESVPLPTDIPDPAPPPGWDDWQPDIGPPGGPPPPPPEGFPHWDSREEEAPPPGYEAPPAEEAPPARVMVSQVEAWLEVATDAYSAAVELGHMGFMDGVEGVLSGVEALKARDIPEAAPFNGEQLERLEVMAMERLSFAMEQFTAALTETAMAQAAHRLSIQAEAHAEIVASGVLPPEQAISMMLRSEAREQEKGVLALSLETLRPIAEHELVVAVEGLSPPAAQETPPVAAGAIRAAPKQGPRMGA